MSEAMKDHPQQHPLLVLLDHCDANGCGRCNRQGFAPPPKIGAEASPLMHSADTWTLARLAAIGPNYGSFSRPYPFPLPGGAP